MESVGQKLRAARLQLGLTLEDIGVKTRIGRRNLQAVENDDLASIGSAFFYRSFVKQYAQQVKLEYGELAEAVQAAASTIPEPLMPGQVETVVQAARVAPLRPAKPKRFRWLYSFTSMVCVLVACSTAYDRWQQSRTAPNPETRAVSAAPVHAAMVPALTQMEGKPDISGLRVELSAVERTWLSLTADGNETFEGMMEPADTKIVEGRQMARVRTGNAGGLNVVFNGKSIGPLGSHGQVRTVVFTREGYQTLTAAPAPLALFRISPTGE